MFENTTSLNFFTLVWNAFNTMFPRRKKAGLPTVAVDNLAILIWTQSDSSNNTYTRTVINRSDLGSRQKASDLSPVLEEIQEPDPDSGDDPTSPGGTQPPAGP